MNAINSTVRLQFDVDRLRAEFPILRQQIHGRPLVYLDNANTTQKPRAVLEALNHYYLESNANIHRANHLLSERATQAYEGAREKVRRFINARDVEEVIFTRGCTEAINLVAQSFARPRLREDDEILLTHLEHHSNIVPWQIVCEATGARLRVAPISDRGELDLEQLVALMQERTRLVAIAHVSNALGTVLPVGEIVREAHARGIPVLVDGAQAAPHLPVDVQALDCDFYAFSGHKLYGPTGVGALYGKRALLDAMPPYQGGGSMIASVSFEKTTYNTVPYRFEAGTPNIAGVVGFGAAVDFLISCDLDAVRVHEHELLGRATQQLAEIPDLRIIGEAHEKCGVVSFVYDDVHPHDVGTVLDQEGVAVRAGQHCAQPVMDRYGVPATVRASFALYNTAEDVDALVRAVWRVRDLFGA
ncbi:MAG: SufS family cysteine desulfurase [Luteitalea sp.]|nr:SufS family cysteine desulfurase [Luteitalea sp.]